MPASEGRRVASQDKAETKGFVKGYALTLHLTDLSSFLRRCQRLEDGFVATHREAIWRLGGVVAIETNQGLASVQKAAKLGYEFSGFWALPGGMIRAAAEEPLRLRIDAALRERVRAEAGLDLKIVTPLSALGPVITCYTAKECLRYTLVAAFESSVPVTSVLAPSDTSIQAARWSFPLADLSGFAPANRLILGHRLWMYLDVSQQAAARGTLTEATMACIGYAVEAGIAPPPPPWALPAEILAWSRSWP